ncbi:MAG TPA: hypothetical protein VM734_00425 [Kofleriaceae bacterium]|nr:hypothetical protein [Kofleriaceae bacterium]
MRKSLAQIAVDSGLISRADLGRAQELADERRVPLVEILVRELGVDEVTLVGAFRRELRMLSVDPRAVKPEADALREVSRDLCRRLRVVPLRVSGPPEDEKEIWLAMADPTDHGAIAEVERVSGAVVDVALLPLSAIEELIERGYKELNTQVVRRGGKVFGGDMIVGTKPHARVGVDDAGEPRTVPFHNIADEADVEMRVAALVRVLIDKGVMTEEDYEAAIRELLKTDG